MMASRILLANYVRMGQSPAAALASANTAICSNNREEMFVTVWMGIMDLTSGRIIAANAGHEYPAIRTPAGIFELFRDSHGFVVGGLENIKYREYEIVMEPGSRLFLYTDGLPEATDADENMFGTDRMLQALNEVGDRSPEEILRYVKKRADAFAADAPMFDDMTMLCLEYRGNVREGRQCLR